MYVEHPFLKKFENKQVKNFYRLMRVDHWIKNFFMFPGCALALTLKYRNSNVFIESVQLKNIAISFIALCIASSANYVINEWLDRDLDSIHPFKSHRVAASVKLNNRTVNFFYIALVILALALTFSTNFRIQELILLLLIMGILYNVKPFRLKDRHYLDVISESINNPIRFAIGWYAVEPNQLVPISAFISFWGIGIFLMALKRYSEMKLINDSNLLATYRKSFAKWDPEKLLVFSMVGALIGSTFMGILLAKRRLEYIFVFPIVILLFVEYLKMSLNLDPASYAPEKLMKKKRLIVLVILLAIAFLTFTVIDVPGLHSFVYNEFDTNKR